jgi:restriction system protein
VQNIAEGSLASATSKETEVKLTNVARASLGELLLDYEDFLRQRGLHQWAMESPEALKVRRLYLSDRSDTSDLSDQSDKIESPSCPKCGKPMRQRTARTGSHAGESFWGCTGYPECKGIKSVGE